MPSLWTVGPNENEDGSFYIMKRNDGAYVLVKRYAKERYNEHRKGNGREDFYEPEYVSKNPSEFIDKVNRFKNRSLTEEGGSVPVGSIGGQMSTADSVPFYAYSGLLKRRNT